MPITAQLLRAIAPSGSAALMEALAPLIADGLAGAEIDSPLRQAHFLAQAAYETWCFRRLAEDLRYTAAEIARTFPKLATRAEALAMHPEALANAAYADRLGNASEASGDGWRYRGRGLFCLTFRGNYETIGRLLDWDLASDPDCVAEPAMAVKTALAYWRARDINTAADADDIGKVTRLVNGGTAGIAERALIKHRALRLLTEANGE